MKIVSIEKYKEFSLEKMCLVFTSDDDNVCIDNIKEVFYNEEKEILLKVREIFSKIIGG